jgi:integrase
MTMKSASKSKKSRKIVYNSDSMITKSQWIIPKIRFIASLDSIYHLIKLSLKKTDLGRIDRPKKDCWEYMMGVCDPEHIGHYVKYSMVRLGTRNDVEARRRVALVLSQAEEQCKLAEAEAIKNADKVLEIRKFFLGEVWAEASSYVKDRSSTGNKLTKNYVLGARRRIEHHFLPWCKLRGYALVTDLTKGRLREWRNWMYDKCKNEGLSSSLVNNTRGSISTALDWAEATDLIEVNPMLSIDKVKEEKKEKQIFTKDEINRLFRATWPDLRVKCIILLAATTGARIGELTALRWKNIHFDKSYIDYVEQYQEVYDIGFTQLKSKKPRLKVHLRSDVAQVLQELKQSYKFLNLCFPDKQLPNKPLARCIVNRILKSVCKEAGIDLNGRGVHCFRHSYFTLLAQIAGIEAASKAGGHSSSKITEDVYIHETEEDRINICNLTDHLFDKAI